MNNRLVVNYLANGNFAKVLELWQSFNYKALT